jgi:fatty acyl-CoA reductase
MARSTQMFVVAVKVFQVLKEKDPTVFDKVSPVSGDICQLGLGMSQEDRKLIAENVNVIFHVAASIQFSDDFMTALKTNTRGTREVAELAREALNLKCLVYFSTAFCNVNKKVDAYEEKLYDSPLDWKTVLDVLEVDPECLRRITPMILYGHPNTYTLTKSLAEQVVQHYSQYYPAVILRPSLVVPTYKEPLEGWTDTLFGVTLVFYMMAVGMSRVVRMPQDQVLANVPCDSAINAAIISAYDQCQRKSESSLSVYNAKFQNEWTSQMLWQEVQELQQSCPMPGAMWHPSVIYTESKFLFSILNFLLHVLPALIVDGVSLLRGKKAKMSKVAMKVMSAANTYDYFQTEKFNFKTEEYYKLEERIDTKEKEIYCISAQPANIKELVPPMWHGILKHVFKGKGGSLKRQKTLKYLHYTTLGLLLLLGALFLRNVTSRIFNCALSINSI